MMQACKRFSPFDRLSARKQHKACKPATPRCSSKNTVATTKILTMTLMTMSSLTLTIYAQAETGPNGQSKKPVVIESQVKGSQEQPKVLYIMPWQGITNPIALSDKEMQIQLPDFRPIHPKSFQQQVSEFNEQRAQVKE